MQLKPETQTPGRTAQSLLAWYDKCARDMPWRVPPQDRKAGVLPDPYRVWLSEIMLQQTTVATVRDYFLRFTMRWPNVAALANAADSDVMGEWAGLGYYARARNLLRCARFVDKDLGGNFPDIYDDLLTLPGVGPYTAAAIAAIAFDQPAVVVDGNVERVMARFFNIQTPLPDAKKILKELAGELTPTARPGDYAQAVMDLGATVCTPRSPLCAVCPIDAACQARAAGTAAQLPVRKPKPAKPVRRGVAYVARSIDGAWLLERRGERGLLGGMLAWPCTEWSDAPEEAPPFPANWQDVEGEVRHTFTHFHLILDIKVAKATDRTCASRGAFMEQSDFRPSDLPTVMRKVYDIASTVLMSS